MSRLYPRWWVKLAFWSIRSRLSRSPLACGRWPTTIPLPARCARGPGCAPPSSRGAAQPRTSSTSTAHSLGSTLAQSKGRLFLEPSKRSRRAACTIIARNYLARARVVAESYLQHEPDGQFFVLVVDGLPDGIELGSCVVALGPNDVDIPEFVEMAFKYDVTELCTAVKPALLSCIFQNYNVDCLVYFDPDIAIFRPLDEMWALLAASDIVLIPHLLDPIPLDGKRPSEQDILTAGAYNLGFIGLHASSEVQRMLDWWNES